MGFFSNVIEGLKKTERFISGKMEEVERYAEPTALKYREKISDWFVNQYQAGIEAQENMWEPIYQRRAQIEGLSVEKWKEQNPKWSSLPSIGVTISGWKQISPRVYRVLQTAVRKGVSPQTIDKVLKIKDPQLVPLYREAAQKIKDIHALTPPKINLDKIDSPDYVKKQVVQWTNKNVQYLSEKYPHQRFVEVQAELEKEGLNINKALGTMKRVFGGDTKKTLVALKGTRDAVITIEKEIATLQKTLRAETDPQKLLLLTARLKEKQLLRDGLWEAVVGSGRVSGQYLAFRNQIASALKAGIGETKNTLIKILGRRFDVGTPQYERFFTALKNLDPNEPKQVMNFLRQAQAPAITDFPASIWYNSVLSGPKTHIVNLMGNTLFGTMESAVQKPISFVLDIPISKLQGRPRIYTSKSMLGYYGGMVRGLKIGTQRFFKTLWTGFDPEELIYPSKWEQLRQTPWSAEFVRFGSKIKAIPKPVKPVIRGIGTVVDVPTRLLKAADVFFKGIFSEARKFEIALPKVWNQSKSVRQIILEADELARTDPTLWDDMVQMGRYMTFQDAPGKITQWIIKGRETIPGFRYIIPFVNIASNLLKRGFIEYAPPGLAKGIHQVIIKDPKAAETMARGMVGTAILTAGALQYLEGNIILNPPRTKAERDAFYRQGKQPWSIKIGNQYYGLRRIEPFGYPFFTGALIVDALQKGKMNEATAIETGGKIAQQLGEFVTDASYLYGLNQMWEAFNAPWDEKGEQFIEWINRMATGFVPYSSILRQIATALNPEILEPTTEFPKMIKGIIPKLKEELPERITVFGKPAEYATGAKGAFLPIAPSTLTQNPVELELERLDYIIGFPQQPKGMTDEQYRIYSKLAGRLSEKAIERLIYHPDYWNMDDNKKRQFIGKTISSIRKEVRSMFGTRMDLWELLFNQFRNAGYSREQSDYMADKALDRVMMQTIPQTP